MGKNARQNIPRAQRDIARLLLLYNQKSKTPKLLIIYFIYLSCCWLENYSLSVQLLKSSHGKMNKFTKSNTVFFLYQISVSVFGCTVIGCCISCEADAHRVFAKVLNHSCQYKQ